MSDPYNSYGSSLPPVAPAPHVASPARPLRDNITRLDVSDAWKRKFRLIEKAGGPELPHFRDLPFGERFSLSFNFLALFFGPIYYIVKGLWRQAVLYFVVALILILILEFVGLGKITRAVGSCLSFIFALRANVSYYKKTVMGEVPWL